MKECLPRFLSRQQIGKVTHRGNLYGVKEQDDLVRAHTQNILNEIRNLLRVHSHRIPLLVHIRHVVVVVFKAVISFLIGRDILHQQTMMMRILVC